MAGLHLEGPLLSRARAGAHREPEIAAARDTLDAVLDDLLAAGGVRLVTLAPEQPGALALIRRLRQAGVAVSIGHSDATFEQAVAAIDAGATLATHLFNAMSPLHHRAPGVVGAALADDRITIMSALWHPTAENAPATNSHPRVFVVVILVFLSSGFSLRAVQPAVAGRSRSRGGCSR